MGLFEELVAAARAGDYAKALRLARSQRGWSQSVLARRLNVERTFVSRLETGRTVFTDPEVVDRFADALDVPPELLAGARFKRTSLEGDDVRRRHLLMSGLLISGVPYGTASASPPRRIGPDDVDNGRRQATHFRAALYRDGGANNIHQALAHSLDRFSAMTSHAPAGHIQTDLLAVTADLAGLAAYAYRDLGDHQRAYDTYVLGVQAAKSAGRPALVGHLFVRMAGHGIEREQPRDVLDFLSVVRRGPLVAATAGERINHYAIEAWALAQMANPQGVHRAVGHAEEYLAATAIGAGDDPWKGHFFSEAEMWSITGAAYTRLARYDARWTPEAVRRLERALALRHEDFARNTTLDLISLAEAHAYAHRIDEASAAARRALGQARQSASIRVRSRLGEMADSLRPYNGRPDIAGIDKAVRMLRGRSIGT